MTACFHCGLPVPAGDRWRASLLGAEREFCCAGCEAVASTIAGAGLAGYYATREALPARAPDEDVRTPPAEYDDAAAQRQFAAQISEDEREAVLVLEGLRCAACAWLCESRLRALPGVTRADVNTATRRAVLRWNVKRVRLSEAILGLRAIGYDAYPAEPRRQADADRVADRRALWRLFVAGFGAMQGMMYAFPAYIDEGAGTLAPDAAQLMRWAGFWMTLPVILVSCAPFFQGALRELRQARIGLDAPITLGILGGFLASTWSVFAASGPVYFDSISMLVFLLLAARYAESGARQRAGRALDRLHRWMPDVALKLADPADWGRAESVPAHALAPGDHVLVPAGGRIPADGVLAGGASSADESMLSGESRPVAKAVGAPLVAGSVNLDQTIVMRVERAGADTRAAAIARLVERAGASRPRLIQAADRVAGVLTLVVLATAALAALGWYAFDAERALWVAVAVLVASCPCALALAAPIVLTKAQGALLARGAAFTGARALETLTRATDIVFDKTGTLTAGRVTIASVATLGSASREDCLALARAMQAGSSHPIARAFLAPGDDPRERGTPQVSALRNVPGQGIEAIVAGRRLRLGSAAFCAAPGTSPDTAVGSDRGAVWLASDSGLLARFELDDGLRPEAPLLVAQLKAQGLTVHLLSGDRAPVVTALAARLGIARLRAEALPEDKLAYVDALQRSGRIVAMIGDGLNDAPVLARADVSIAMAAGVAAAQRQADVVLLGDSLAAVGPEFELSRSAMRTIRQNFAWALAYNIAVLPLAAFGLIGPWQAAFGMAASSIVVTVNSLRGWREPKEAAAPAMSAQAG
jgi:Cu2+-exporting ATPase